MRQIITIALTLLAGAGLVAAAPAAPARASITDCTMGLFCAWSGKNYTGSFYYYPYSLFGPSHGCNNIQFNNASPHFVYDNNNWESVANYYGNAGQQDGPVVYYYDSHDCTGTPGPLYHNQAVPQIGSLWFNKVSSFRVVD